MHTVYSEADPWQWPGGTAEPGEGPWETALRECHAGIVVEGPPRLLTALFGLPGAQCPLITVGCVFDGGRLSTEQFDATTLNPASTTSVQWHWRSGRRVYRPGTSPGWRRSSKPAAQARHRTSTRGAGTSR
ncbi:NUDIX hydrolase [Streptomyces sp. LX-29]|uniref:NUDIX domain-containing protein n=1 Tax=Streptomyces sp. LX-29 TaxID=2900152 RepID=UPI00240D5A09|nr:NUDIX hydrolase [Streptomyces sp. LX-29]WFB11357.1 NUDIX hydrolase [Streptomyces sp. LX-29]